MSEAAKTEQRPATVAARGASAARAASSGAVRPSRRACCSRKRAGPGGARLVRREVAEAPVLAEDEELGGVAADLDDAPRAAGAQCRTPAGDGEEGVDGRDAARRAPCGTSPPTTPTRSVSSREGLEIVEESLQRRVAAVPSAG